MVNIFPTLLIFFYVVCLGCNEFKEDTTVKDKPSSTKTNKSVQPEISYDFTKPEIIVLDKDLMEISGLAYNTKKDVLLAHNDEKGHVYEIAKQDGNILSYNRFGKKGDYESIEYYDDKYVISTSSGNLHFFDPKSKDTDLQKTSLSSKNDVEGMCLSPDKSYLLLACKGQSNEESSSKKIKAVYAFDLNLKTLLKKPYLNILDSELESKVKQDHANESKSKIKKLINRSKDFSPSGIAVHPVTKEYYLISARGSTVVILNSDKEVSKVVFLDNDSYKQPEGICFDKEETLYISLEGRGLSAKILKFTKP